MRFTVNTTQDNISKLLSWVDNIILKDRYLITFDIAIQNLWSTNIYLENWGTATVENSYLLLPWNQITFKSCNLSNINIISEWSSNNNIRIIII
jgi:hypothetical protein